MSLCRYFLLWNVFVVETDLPPACVFVYDNICDTPLSLSHRISDIGLRQFLDGPASVRIRELNLTNCSLLGDVSVVRLSER